MIFLQLHMFAFHKLFVSGPDSGNRWYAFLLTDLI